MKSSSWMVVVFAVAVTASLVAAKSILSATERAQAAAPTQARAQLIPITDAAQPMLAAHRQPPAPGASRKAPAPAKITKASQAAPSDGTWTVLVVQGGKREYVTYNSMRRITPVN